MKQDAPSLLAAGLEQLDIQLNAQAQEKLIAYLALLDKWNHVFNLTAIHDLRQAVILHLLDSLSILPWLPPGNLADLGSGAGLPGIPLAIAEPERTLHLIEAQEKKVRFLTQVKLSLGLSNLSPIHKRVQDWHPLHPLPILTSRALTSLKHQIDWVHNLLDRGAELFAMKGRYPQVEIEALVDQPYAVQVIRLALPFNTAERHLVHIRAQPTGVNSSND